MAMTSDMARGKIERTIETLEAISHSGEVVGRLHRLSGDVAECREALRALTSEIERLRNVCAEAYQLAGAVAAPARVLDQLHAAAEGHPLPHDSFLPVSADECGSS